MLIYNASQKPCKDTTFSRFTAIKEEIIVSRLFQMRDCAAIIISMVACRAAYKNLSE